MPYNRHCPQSTAVPIVRKGDCDNNGFVLIHKALTSVSSWQCHHNILIIIIKIIIKIFIIKIIMMIINKQCLVALASDIILTSLWRTLVLKLMAIIISSSVLSSSSSSLLSSSSAWSSQLAIFRRSPTRQSRRLAARGSSLARLHCHSRHTWLLLLWKGRQHRNHHLDDLRVLGEWSPLFSSSSIWWCSTAGECARRMARGTRTWSCWIKRAGGWNFHSNCTFAL